MIDDKDEYERHSEECDGREDRRCLVGMFVTTRHYIPAGQTAPVGGLGQQAIGVIGHDGERGVHTV